MGTPQTSRWNPHRFVYLDGDKADVLGDLERFYPKVAPGGVLAGHDLSQDRVRRAVVAFLASLPATPRLRETAVQTPRLDVRGVPIPPCCPSWYFRKPEEELLAT